MSPFWTLGKTWSRFLLQLGFRLQCSGFRVWVLGFGFQVRVRVSRGSRALEVLFWVLEALEVLALGSRGARVLGGVVWVLEVLGVQVLGLGF